ncbi:MAG: DUF5131 family protein [Candidatus Heimdallarchaeota archaeon]
MNENKAKLTRTNIDWCTHTWSICIGCKRNCSYCYARDFNRRFKFIPDFNKPQFFPEKLAAPRNRKKPAVIFVASMSDPEYWEYDWWVEILSTVKNNPQHKFMFLSKSPFSYGRLIFPNNCYLGLTITGKEKDIEKEIFLFLKYSSSENLFISFEPLLDNNIDNNKLGLIIIGAQGYDDLSRKLKLIIVGAQSGKNKVIPKQSWVDKIKSIFPKNKLFWKDSMKDFNVDNNNSDWANMLKKDYRKK